MGDLGLCCLVSDPIAANEGEARYCAGELINGIDATLGPSISMAAQFGLRAAETAAPSTNSSSSSFKAKPLDLTKADIFSLGASVYELCKGSPLAGDGDTDENDLSEWHELRAGCLDVHVSSLYSNELMSFIRQMITANPLERPSASEVVDMCIQHERSQDFSRNEYSDALNANVNYRFESLLKGLGIPVQEDVISQVESILRDSVGRKSVS